MSASTKKNDEKAGAIIITDDNHLDELGGGSKCIVDFWAEWCGPCRMLSPLIDDLAAEHNVDGGKIKICKIDVDSSPGAAAKYGIRSIPTVLFIKDGDVVDKHVGAISKEALNAKLEDFSSK